MRCRVTHLELAPRKPDINEDEEVNKGNTELEKKDKPVINNNQGIKKKAQNSQ